MHESPTTDRFIPKVLDVTSCKRHKVPEGIPCFHVRSEHISGYYPAVCNSRAKAAGFNHAIDPKSLNRGEKTYKKAGNR